MRASTGRPRWTGRLGDLRGTAPDPSLARGLRLRSPRRALPGIVAREMLLAPPARNDPLATALDAAGLVATLGQGAAFPPGVVAAAVTLPAVGGPRASLLLARCRAVRHAPSFPSVRLRARSAPSCARRARCVLRAVPQRPAPRMATAAHGWGEEAGTNGRRRASAAVRRRTRADYEPAAGSGSAGGTGSSLASPSSSRSARRATDATRSPSSRLIRRTPCVLRPITRISLTRRRITFPPLVTSMI